MFTGWILGLTALACWISYLLGKHREAREIRMAGRILCDLLPGPKYAHELDGNHRWGISSTLAHLQMMNLVTSVRGDQTPDGWPRRLFSLTITGRALAMAYRGLSKIQP